MRFFWLIPTAIVVWLDQFTKHLVRTNMYLDNSNPHTIPVIEGVLNWKYITNDGASFGKLDNCRWVFMSVSTIIIIGISIFMFTKRFQKYYNPFIFTALSFILGGGIGNMIDRIFLGEVTDFIDFQPLISFWKWIFNVADSFVCIGCVMIILYLIISDIKETKNKKADSVSE